VEVAQIQVKPQVGTSSGGGKSYGSDSSGDSYDRLDRFAEVKTQISAQNYAEAYDMLVAIGVQRDDDDRQNLLGFTSRKAGDFAVAWVHYESALDINPKHLGALEYQGELFIALGDFEKAS
jgi:tetratricopeptide (TPR) repeat protein